MYGIYFYLPHSMRKSTCAVFSLLVFLFFGQIAFRPLANPDEGRYAEIAREILQSGDWLTPRLNGLLYFEKPPFVYWCTALGERLFGTNVFGARFFNALFALLTCFCVYRFCTHFFNRTFGNIAAGILGTSLLWCEMSQLITLDVTLSFFITASILSFAWGFLTPHAGDARKHFFLAYIFVAFAVLTKGFIGLIAPALVGLPWLILTGHWRKLGQSYLIRGCLLIVLINFPWHYLMAVKYPEFCHFYFWHEHFERYLLPDHNRMKPFYFLPLSFLFGMFPWVLFFPRALCASAESWHSKWVREIVLLGTFWSLGLVGFFSFSHSQLIPYILPAIPGGVLILACAFTKPGFIQKCRLECALWASILLLLACSIPYISAKRALIPIPVGFLVELMVVMILITVVALLFLIKRYVARAFVLLLTLTCLLYSAFPCFFSYFQRDQSGQMSRFILKQGDDDAQVYCAYYYFQDLPFYLHRYVGTINHVPDEQTLGYRSEPCDRYIVSDTLRYRWTLSKRIFVLVRRQQRQVFEGQMSELPLYNLTNDAYFALYSNRR